LLVVPVALVGIGLVFDIREQGVEANRAERARQLEEQQAQDVALQAYLDQMSTLLTEKDLRASDGNSEVRLLARARTLTVLERLDPSRRAEVMQFLIEARLVQAEIRANDRGVGVVENYPVISLDGANLSGADRSRFEPGAPGTSGILYVAELRGAQLHYADLSGADLSWTQLQEANLLISAEVAKRRW